MSTSNPNRCVECDRRVSRFHLHDTDPLLCKYCTEEARRLAEAQRYQRDAVRMHFEETIYQEE